MPILNKKVISFCQPSKYRVEVFEEREPGFKNHLPPSIFCTVPVMNDELSDRSQATKFATSEG